MVSSLIDPSKMIMLPVTEYEYLKDQIKNLTRILESHLYRDASVSEILSGSEAHWLCQEDLEDLREQLRETGIAMEANYELHRENESLRAIVLEIPVTKEEQLEIIRQALRDGEL